MKLNYCSNCSINAKFVKLNGFYAGGADSEGGPFSRHVAVPTRARFEDGRDINGPKC